MNPILGLCLSLYKMWSGCTSLRMLGKSGENGGHSWDGVSGSGVL